MPTIVDVVGACPGRLHDLVRNHVLAGTGPRTNGGYCLEKAQVGHGGCGCSRDVGVGGSSDQSGRRADAREEDLYVIGVYEIKGESPLGINNFDDGAKLAVKELQKKGWTVKYERIPASATAAASQEAGVAAGAAEAARTCGWDGLQWRLHPGRAEGGGHRPADVRARPRHRRA